MSKDSTLGDFSSEAKPAPKNGNQVHAAELAKKQREIGVGEFFARNKHLLGFDNPRKGLLTTVKEAVDNSIDACEEAHILPEISVQVIDMGKDRFRVIIEDNGPGIVEKQIPKIFAKLLYGSKFHSKKQQRGQQGIGISASVMYGQLTTGRAAKIISKTDANKPAQYVELHINTQQNKPEIVKKEQKEWKKDHGTKIEIDIEGSYQKGGQSIDEYLKETAVVNPHVTLVYVNPKAEQFIFPRVSEAFPKEAKEIKPHPHGIEMGVMLSMLHDTEAKTLQQFLTSEFSRISPAVAKEVCAEARLETKMKPKKVGREDAENMVRAFRKVKIMAPPTDCLSPITAELLEKGLKKEVNAEFYTSITRAPVVYKGNPFQVEVAIAYGGEQLKDRQAKLMRFANRVPLLYQQGACGVTKGVTGTNWKSYGLQQSGSNLPVGPLTIVVHIASVWVPFTSESKEAIAHYEDIIKEIKLALQEAGRVLGIYVKKKHRVNLELKKRGYIEKYIPKLADAIVTILGEGESEKEAIETHLVDLLEKTRGEVEDMAFDPSKNVEYDAEFAKIGKEEKVEEPHDEEQA
ncbi:DNA topoisomerase VI subunit B [Candidatus Woesearchaeota archaeon]|nr:DNA topoisomerase VI subunit B [Candidatus Woesearchaeota archaeon]